MSQAEKLTSAPRPTGQGEACRTCQAGSAHTLQIG